MESRRSGQSLAEVLIAVAIGAILITAGIALIVPALQSNTDATKVQAAASYAQGLMSNVIAWSQGNWNNVLALATGTANTYYLNTSSSPFTASAPGSVQSISIGTTTYTRSFYLSDVQRDSGDNIVTSGGNYDPSTKLVTVTYQWLGGPVNTMTTYIVRSNNQVSSQNNWSGGPGFSGPETSTNSQFASSTNIDYTTPTGSLYLAIPGY
jgi:type II secretory pathway pseudopilin PulG